MTLNEVMKNTADAIREKKGTTELIAPVNFADEIKGITSGGAKPKCTGHADAAGLKAIGWTDDDIAYYQENGVNWNKEDDEYHKVTDDNKALYGVLTSGNIQTYRDRIVYLPKIDTSNVTSMVSMFTGCYSLTAIPLLDTSKVTSMNKMFYNCYSLTAIPLLDTSKVTNMSNMFYNCYSLTAIPLLDTSKVTNMVSMLTCCYSLTSVPMLDTRNVANIVSMFTGCYSLTSIPLLDTRNVTDMNSAFSNCRALTSFPLLDTRNVTNMGNMFSGCNSLISIPLLDTSKVKSTSSMFSNCYSLTHANIKNVKLGYKLSNATLLSKDSLLYIINNEAATSAITITLASYAYDRLAADHDVVTALTNHPNISLASA